VPTPYISYIVTNRYDPSEGRGKRVCQGKCTRNIICGKFKKPPKNRPKNQKKVTNPIVDGGGSLLRWATSR
jgi:hypothetical protein